MLIGIPREIKEQEYRVAVTPAGVAELARAGHGIRVQTGAGCAIGFGDDAYRAAGAELVSGPEAVYAADLVCKVKEPQPGEITLLRPGQILLCYLHLAAAPELATALARTGVIAVAYETVQDAAGRTPLLAPMSQVAGRLAIQFGMAALEMKNGGRGVLLPGVPGVLPGRVVIVGGGQVGANAARVAVGLGADVTLIDRDPERLRQFDDLYGARLKTRFSSAATIEECVTGADLLVGAVYLPGRRTPHLVPRDWVARMPRGAAIVDVSIDQGGMVETSRPTTHQHPFHVEEGVVHCGVTNMPGAVARTSTLALTEVTLPYLTRLAGLGPREAFRTDPGFAAGLNLAGGQVTHAGLAEDLGRVPVPWPDALPA